MPEKSVKDKMSSLRETMVKFVKAYQSGNLDIKYADYEDILKEFNKKKNNYEETKKREDYLKRKKTELQKSDDMFKEYIDLLKKLGVNSKELEGLTEKKVEETIPKKDQGVYNAWRMRAQLLQRKLLELFLINTSTLDDIIISQNVVIRKISEEIERANKILGEMPTEYIKIEGSLDVFYNTVDGLLISKKKEPEVRGGRTK